MTSWGNIPMTLYRTRGKRTWPAKCCSEMSYGLETRPSSQNVRRETQLRDAGSRGDRDHPPDPGAARYGEVAFLPLPVLRRLPFRPYRHHFPPARQWRLSTILLNRRRRDTISLAFRPRRGVETQLFWGEHAIGRSV